MTDRREPIFSSDSSLNEHELADDPRPSRASAVRESIHPRAAGRAAHRNAGSSRASGGSGLASLLAFVALGAAGFAIWQGMQFKTYFASSEARISELENKLAVTGDESQESLAALQVKIKTLGDELKTASSEIKKLWGVTYDTNRKNIAAQKKDIEKLQKSGKSLTEKLQDQASDITLINDLVEAQQSGMTRAEKLAKDAEAKISSLKNEMDQLSNLDDELKKRIAKNEEAVKAIDAFRLSVYKDINALKGMQ